MQTVLKPAPPDLWHRLAALDRQCALTMERCSAWSRGEHGLATGGPEFPRMWRIRIWPRGRALALREAVVCTGADFAEVLAGAVRMAEEKGWNGAGSERGTS